MRSLLSTRRAAVAAATLPLLLGVAACGADETAPAAADAADRAATSPSGDEGTAADQADADQAASEETEPEEAEETGAEAEETEAGNDGGSWDEETLAPAMVAAMAEQETGRFTMTTTGGGADVEAEGVMSLRSGGQDMAMTMSGATLGVQSMEMRMVDGVVYLSMPPMTPKGKFFEIDPGDAGSPFSGMTDQMRVDPRESLKAFESGLREVEYLGEEPVDGESLERYRLTVDFAAAAKAQGLPRTQGAPETVAYDVWLDDDALLRRMQLEMMQVSMVMEMSGWGEPVRIQAPPRRQIVQAPGMPGS